MDLIHPLIKHKPKEEYNHRLINPLIRYNPVPYQTKIEPYLDPNDIDCYPGELWLPVTHMMIFAVKPYYLISNYGRVYSTNIQSILLTHGGGRDKAYLYVSLRTEFGNNYYIAIHRLVMLAFNYNPYYSDFQVNHKNGKKDDNDLANIEWSTRNENMQHAYDNDLNHKGIDHYSAVYTEAQVHTVCQGLQDNLVYDQIARNAGLEFCDRIKKFISEIKVGRIWKHISKDYIFPKERSDQLFSNDQVRKVCEGIRQGLGSRDIMVSIGIDYDPLSSKAKNLHRIFIFKIKKGQLFTSISKDYNFKK